MAKADLSAQRLRELLHYDSGTGDFTRKIAGRGTGAKVGDLARYISNGYIRLYVDGIRYSAQRLAWLYVHGAWPTVDIDHIDGNPANNRISNLRDVPSTLNAQNLRRAHKDNESGFLGVYSHSTGKWRAQIRSGSTRLSLGVFTTPEDAHQAYLNAKRDLHEGCTI